MMTESNLQICRKTEDLIEFNKDHDFWLKPITRIHITVQLPQMKTPNSCISTWEVMEKLKKKARPHHFKTLKVAKSTIEFIRFEGELDSKAIMEFVLARIDRVTLKLSGFAESLKVRAAKVKIGSSRHEWESFFRDNPHMNEMKPGYRPDTIHLQNLPVKWFGGEKPKCDVLVKVFSVFGDIRRFHIPSLDDLDVDEKLDPDTNGTSGFKRFNFTETLHFDAFIMYRDYISFVKAMDTLRGMKLVKKLDELNRYLEYDIKVGFDKTKHLSDKTIKRRKLARDHGIKNAKELRELKERTKKHNQEMEERIKLLTKRKERSKNLLKSIFKDIEVAEIERRKKDEAAKAEQKLRERLLYEEVKLREKLLERRREQIRQNVKDKGGGLKSVAASIPSSFIGKTFKNNSPSPLSSTCLSPPLCSLSPGTVNHDQNHRSLYKTHKRSCKHYKRKSLIVTMNSNESD